MQRGRRSGVAAEPHGGWVRTVVAVRTGRVHGALPGPRASPVG
ncbi:hypothetical protein SAMN05660350_01609 [Geodermatophilus obscurus]|uniref:Uncharacterized protein n=1 Tax=Geodermatophilus obscurus TaxID=1861 RepID=A0A1M7TDY2_9ACTN|nr:hypothetical protein SAMN05660350_01609 [Geodermatophilus obscurus]